jgi:hypothetical protein
MLLTTQTPIKRTTSTASHRIRSARVLVMMSWH